MIVNASSAMIRMTLSGKEILAARVLIIVIRWFFLQIFTLAAIGSTIAYIASRFDLLPLVFWWGSIEAEKAIILSDIDSLYTYHLVDIVRVLQVSRSCRKS